MSLPRIVSPRSGTTARRALLEKEKAATRARDALNIERRELPMVEVTKDYAFEGPDGTASLRRPVRGAPAADRVPLHVPPGLGRRLPELHGRHRRDLARVHRAPAHAGHDATPWCPERRSPSSSAGRRSAGWDHIPWYSTNDGDFSYDFGATIDASRGFDEFNYRTLDEYAAMGEESMRDCRAALRHARPHVLPPGRRPHLPHVLRVRAGLESTGGSYYFLDLTALGRQEDWEEPKGRSESRARQPARLPRVAVSRRPSPGSRAGPS